MRERIFNSALAAVLVLAAIVGGMAVAGSAAPGKQVYVQGSFYREVTFDSANVITADEATTAVTGFAKGNILGFEISCTEDSGTATLDVALQRSIDGGTVWSNVLTMTQLSATGNETKFYADLLAASAQMIGNRLRVNYDITGSGQYTCSAYGAFES